MNSAIQVSTNKGQGKAGSNEISDGLSTGGKDGYGCGKAIMIESSERTRYSSLFR